MVLDAAVYLLVFVIITVSQAGKPERETEGGEGEGESGDCATAARAGVTQVHRYHIMRPFVFIQVNPKRQVSTF